MNDMAGIGHNLGPELLGPEHVTTPFAERYESILARMEQLAAAAEKVPTITDETTAGKAGDLVRMIKACAKAGGDAHDAEKEPYLKAGRAIDDYFRPFTGKGEKLDRARGSVEAKIKTFVDAENEKRRKAEAAERARQDAERRAAEEAARAAAAEAGQAEPAIAPPPPPPEPVKAPTIRTDMGGTVSTKVEWYARLVDLDALDLNTLKPFLPIPEIEKALLRAARQGELRAIPGAEIYSDTVVNTR